jgi:hypothetical protein
VFTNLKSGEGVDSIIDFIIDQGGVKQNSRIARSSLRLIRFGFEDSFGNTQLFCLTTRVLGATPVGLTSLRMCCFSTLHNFGNSPPYVDTT